MHKVLKYCVYEKKRIRRVDNCIHLVTKLFNNNHSEYLQKLKKPRCNQITSQIPTSSVVKNKSLFNVIKEGDQFIVHDLKNNDTHKVDLMTVDSHECHLVCLQCGFWNHNFKCNCIENQNGGIFCHHIHSVGLYPEILPSFGRPENKKLNIFETIKFNTNVGASSSTFTSQALSSTSTSQALFSMPNFTNSHHSSNTNQSLNTF